MWYELERTNTRRWFFITDEDVVWEVWPNDFGRVRKTHYDADIVANASVRRDKPEWAQQHLRNISNQADACHCACRCKSRKQRMSCK